MKRIKNVAMRGATLNVPEVGLVLGDSEGIFEVPEAFADRLLGTPGWYEATESEDPSIVAKRESELKAQAERDAAAFEKREQARLAAIEEKKRAEAQAENVRADEELANRLAEEARKKIEEEKEAEAARVAKEEREAAERRNAMAEVAKDMGVVVEDEGAEDEGPDLDELDKEGLVKVAASYGVPIDMRWGEKRLRETLNKALYEDEEGEK